MAIEAIGAVQGSQAANSIGQDEDDLKKQAMNLPELASELKQLEDSQLIANAVTKIMDVKDIDRDGKLSQKELGFSDRIFRNMDTDKSGFIEDQELRSKSKEVKEIIRNVADVVGLMNGGPSVNSLKSLMKQNRF